VDRSKLSILLADRHLLFREAVRSILDGESDLRVAATAGEGFHAVAEAQRIRPQVALLSANLVNCDGIGAAAMIKTRVPECRVVVLSGHADHAGLARAVEAGASGFLLRDCSLAELISAIRSVHQGETLVPPRMLGQLLENLSGRRRDRQDALKLVSSLTRREAEVLALLARGSDNDAMASSLFISPQTARTHVQNVLAKLDVHSRLEAAAFVNRNGILAALEERGGIAGRPDRAPGAEPDLGAGAEPGRREKTLRRVGAPERTLPETVRTLGVARPVRWGHGSSGLAGTVGE
jgi:two-component system response regulator DegU